MPCQNLVTAMREQSPNCIPHLQGALTVQVKYWIANFCVSVNLISRFIVGWSLCDAEASELDINAVCRQGSNLDE